MEDLAACLSARVVTKEKLNHIKCDGVSSVLEHEDAQEAATMKSVPFLGPKSIQVLNEELRGMMRDLRQSRNKPTTQRKKQHLHRVAVKSQPAHAPIRLRFESLTMASSRTSFKRCVLIRCAPMLLRATSAGWHGSALHACWESHLEMGGEDRLCGE
eukprot:4228428-Amphidinium_carterae.3